MQKFCFVLTLNPTNTLRLLWRKKCHRYGPKRRKEMLQSSSRLAMDLGPWFIFNWNGHVCFCYVQCPKHIWCLTFNPIHKFNSLEHISGCWRSERNAYGMFWVREISVYPRKLMSDFSHNIMKLIISAKRSFYS